ncbi:DUF6286 domain-containing protein [Aquipuribacter sp. SD81]|uniref:DUF6286 domain-containing protein n=1 Tax=Aquipuribacter sp. SD81 TaxID=3127703 RepID=UPI00301B0321
MSAETAAPAHEETPTRPDAAREATVPTAGVPLGVPAVAGVAVVLCLALVAAGVVLLREVLVDRVVAGRVLVPGEPWLAPAAEEATGVVQGTLTVGVGAVSALVGLLLLVLAVRRRPRLGTAWRPADAELPLWVSGAGVAAVAADAALAADPVETSRARARRRRVDVDVSVDPRDGHGRSAVETDVRERVEQALRGLATQPRVRVHVHGAVAR